jgi:hypothetical protein
MSSRLQGEVKKLRRELGPANTDGGPCPDPQGLTILTYRPAQGEREPRVPEDLPADARRCPVCGDYHTLVLKVQVVKPGDPGTPSGGGDS